MSPSPVPSYVNYEYKEESTFFTEAFASFDELRKGNVMTDIVLTTINYPQISLDNEKDSCEISEGNHESQNQSKVSKKTEFLVTLNF